ncbi:hypothetical protein ACVXHB_28380 [Escherichia coli]
MSETHKISAELLASRRQINQLLNWHWKLKPQNNLPELISGWRGELMAKHYTIYCRNIRRKLPKPDGRAQRHIRLWQTTNPTPGVYPSHANNRSTYFAGWHALHR